LVWPFKNIKRVIKAITEKTEEVIIRSLTGNFEYISEKKYPAMNNIILKISRIRMYL
jgi:hypothetical protein